ncbi:MAG TPA: hypothetical protein VLF69_02930 [Candidatus Saccharimonadales bacterium]|nr:hypothetical protein [Candidatus Saccharimonadales bacterium]
MDSDKFVYSAYRLSDDRCTVQFDYQIVRAGQAYDLTETLEFPVALLETPEQQRSLRALHLALGVSYYKKFLAPAIVHPYAMDAAEADFWNTMWQHGLGEFLYVNKLSAEQLTKFAPQDGQRFESNNAPERSGALLGIGGGKDSIVAGELLRDLAVPVTGFVLATGEQVGQAAAVAGAMGVDLLVVKRTIDPMTEIRKLPGSYSGHVPISMIFGLVGAALAVATDKAYVVVANEASASIPRVQWQEQAINHQWSKSLEAEQRMQAFIRSSVSAGVTYFSAIRQLTSIGVAKLFARFPQYFTVFTSDNFVFRIDPSGRPVGRWGLESPKSLSSYILLAPWLSDADVAHIFERDFLDEPSLEQLFLELTGTEGEQPLDCVGTVEELTLSVNRLAETGRYSNTVLMKLAVERGLVHDDDWRQIRNKLLALQPDEALPPELHDAITDYLQKGVTA